MDSHVNFACQRCSQILKVHSTLRSLDSSTFQELCDGGNMCRGTSCGEFSHNDFCSVEDTRKIQIDEQNRQARALSRLFDILSDQSDIDHPLCVECADYVMDQMDNQLYQLEQECKENKEFMLTLQQRKQQRENVSPHLLSASPGSSYASNKDNVGIYGDNELNKATCDLEHLKKELDRLQNEEANMIKELEDVAADQAKADSKLAEQQKQLNEMKAKNDKAWHEYNHLKYTLFYLDDELMSAENQLNYVRGQLDRLRKTNVFNATFHIWHTGHFATINGFRLGRLPKFPVDWNEINAAWGQCVLLLHCLAKKINLTFQRYKLVPYGNHSFIEALDNKSRELPLYGSGGFRFIWNNKFDQAMVAFLDCLQQFKEQIEKEDSAFCLPYRMDKGRIEDTKNGYSFSIKTQFNSEEQWTKALKFMLTNLKWSLAFVASNSSE
ncbi:Beclin-1, partial [Fragariocoptes setiger]